MERVIVIGGGIAGLRLAKKLNATLITDDERFVFKPLLTDSLHEGPQTAQKKITYPDIILGRATKVNTMRKTVTVEGTEIPYDILAVCLGAEANLTVPGTKTYAQTFYTADHAETLRGHPPTGRVVIIGGGATGVELAMELAQTAQVRILHRGEEILDEFHPAVQRIARKHLEKAGVALTTQAEAKRITSRHVKTQDEDIPYDTVIWAAGVKARIIPGLPGKTAIPVNDYLQVEGHEEIFAAGDCARTGAPLQAQAAVQEADHLARNIKRYQRGKPLKRFTYHEKGRMLALRQHGVLDAGIVLDGALAHLVRRAYYAWQLRRY